MPFQLLPVSPTSQQDVLEPSRVSQPQAEDGEVGRGALGKGVKQGGRKCSPRQTHQVEGKGIPVRKAVRLQTDSASRELLLRKGRVQLAVKRLSSYTPSQPEQRTLRAAAQAPTLH